MATPQPISSAALRLVRILTWIASLASLIMLSVVMFASVDAAALAALGLIEMTMTVAFGIEFFTRPGFRTNRRQYVAWRWFDFLAMVPIIFLLPYVTWGRSFWMWTILVARSIRAIDRTLGDGFVQRNVFALIGALEEEITDRVLLRIISRLENEISRARFGEAAAQALARNREALLERIYIEQITDGPIARLAALTGLQEALERAESKMFDSIEAIVGSNETDEAIRDVIQSALGRARQQISIRSWKRQVGIRPTRVAHETPS